MKKKKTYILLFSVVFIVVFACVEPFEEGTLNFEKALVVEATITNELKYQEIKLSSTFRLEDDKKPYEINAQVTVTDDTNNTYNFQEIDSGVYRSTIKFQAEIDRNYQLNITRSNGKKYTSTNQKISSVKGLDSIYAVKSIGNRGNEGISIYVDSYDVTKKSNYYRYKYTETYKVLAPHASASDVLEVSYNPPVVEIVPRVEEKRICYTTIPSTKIVQNQTVGLSEDRITRFPILFIDERDFKTIYRYSILVTQYVQSVEAYSYYKTLNKFSGGESILSQIQTGTFIGNVFAEENKEEKVLGFFEVASVSSQRIYFNHHDFFPDNIFPRYFTFCNFTTPLLETPALGTDFAGSPLIDAIRSGDWVFFEETGSPLAPVTLVNAACGDCTSYASNIKPPYWID